MVIYNSDWEFLYDDNTLKKRKHVAANGIDDCIPLYKTS